jgi:iron(III) transport system substrate-binding protein
MRTETRVLCVLSVLSVLSCSDPRTPVVVYSPHGRDQLTLLEHAFEAKHPDIDVRWLDMGSQEILDRLRFERVNPQADVWFGGPTTIFDRGVSDSLLAPYRPAWASHVGPRGVGADDRYYPAYRTPAVIAFNSRVVPRDQAPSDWNDVLAPRWFDKVLIRDPMASGTMRAIWGLIIEQSLRATGDTTRGMAWLRRLDGQTKAYALNPAILDARLARAEGLVTLWDLPDILISKAKGMPFDYVFPRSGTVVIDDAIGLVRGSRHPEAARAFIDFVGSEEGQLLAAEKVYRLPARRDLPPERVPAWVAGVEREMVVADVDWDLLSREGPAWMGYWDRHVRGTGRERGR